MQTLFVSAADADAAIAETIAATLEEAGFFVVLPLRRPGGGRFIRQHQAALEEAARVVALLSPAYLADDYCSAEWQSVLAADPLNKHSRLIVMRIADCRAPGALAGLSYWDLAAVTDSSAFTALVREAVGAAVNPAGGTAAVPRARAPVSGNLPADLTPFLGRDAQLAEIEALLDEHRLLTLVGAGGIGKTRTALAVAARRAERYPHGVWFVDFAPLSNGADVVPEIAAVLGVRDDPGEALVAAIAARLKEQRALLILDNCEHVISPARDAADALVAACAGVTVLATSREILAARGEVVYRLPTLTVPAGNEPLSAAQAGAFEAVALFAARARAADAHFNLTDANASTIARICTRLDGIALAIELAAARVAVLDVDRIDAKLDERFRLLSRGKRSALPRQQTLRALIDWSYDLLDADLQQLFRRVAIFAGGWNLEGAMAVCCSAGADEFTTLDQLMSLADKSLIVVDVVGESSRFSFLESTRAYALERARQEEDVDDLERRRAAFFAAFAGDGTAVGADMVARVAAIDLELENVRAVLRWALEDGHDVRLGAGITCALGRFWSTRMPREGLQWLTTAQARLDAHVDRGLLADVATATAALLPHGSAERFAGAEHALAAHREVGDPVGLTRALASYGEQLTAVGRDDEAEGVFAEALERARRIGNSFETGRALAGLTMLAVDRQEIEAARRFGRQAIAVFDELGAIDGVAYVCVALGDAEYVAGNCAHAMDLVRRARAAYGTLHNHRSSAGAAAFFATLALLAGRADDARAAARDAIETLGTDFHPLFLTEAIGSLAHVATLTGDAERGALLYGYYETAYGTQLHVLTGCELHCTERHRELLDAAFGSAELARRISAGAQLSTEAARELALSV